VKTIMFIVFLLMFVSCKGGGSSGSSASSDTLVSMSIYMDKPIEGLTYTTSRGRSGMTDSSGALDCYNSELVLFNIGEQPVGMAVCQADKQWLLFELSGAVNQLAMSSVDIVIATLDIDQDSSNGYQLPDTSISTVNSGIDAIHTSPASNRTGSVPINLLVGDLYPDLSRDYVNDAASAVVKNTISGLVDTYQDLVKTNDFSNMFVAGGTVATTSFTGDLSTCGYDDIGFHVQEYTTWNGVTFIPDTSKITVSLFVYLGGVQQTVFKFHLLDSEDNVFISRLFVIADYRTGILSIDGNTSTDSQNSVNGTFKIIDDNNFTELCNISFTASCVDLNVDGACD
jgi:hypothetical protein